VYLGSVIKRYFELIQDLCIQHSLGATFPIRIATKLLPNFMLQSVMGKVLDLLGRKINILVRSYEGIKTIKLIYKLKKSILMFQHRYIRYKRN